MVNKKVKKRIDAYLKSVRKNIRDKSAMEKRELLRSLTEHIYGALEARFPDSPSLDDVEMVLDELDRPEAFQADSSSNLHLLGWNLGVWALVVLVSSILLPLFITAIALIAGVTGDIASIAMVMGIVLLIIALSLGIVGRKHPAGKAALIASAILIGALILVLPMRFSGSNEESSSGILNSESDISGE